MFTIGLILVGLLVVLAFMGVATAKTIIGGPGRRGPNVFSGATAPTVDNDVSVGHMKGDKFITSAGSYICLDATDAAAVWVLEAGGPVASGTGERVVSEITLGGGSVLRRAYIEEAKAIVTAASANLTTQLPAGARVIEASLNFDTVIVLSTAVKVGLGTAGDPDGFALSDTTLTKNTKTHNPAPTLTNVAVATTVVIKAVDTDGAAAGTVTSGTIRARVLYEYATAIANAP